MLRVTYRPSTSHWIFPPIILGILALLLAVMTVQRAIRCRRAGQPFFDWEKMRFFEPGCDKLKLSGSVVLFVLYIYAMEYIGFLAASIVFVFLYSVLFYGVERLKEIPAALRSGKPWSSAALRSVCVSLALSALFSTAVWFLFARVFRVTLP
jgi:hypothetical protein